MAGCEAHYGQDSEGREGKASASAGPGSDAGTSLLAVVLTWHTADLARTFSFAKTGIIMMTTV